MTRPLALTERQIVALCRGAAKAGHVPVIEVGKVLVRLIPENHPSLTQESDKVDGKGKGYF